MKKLLVLAIAAVAFGIAGQAFAAPSNVVTINATVTFASALVISLDNTSVDFGSVDAGAATLDSATLVAPLTPVTFTVTNTSKVKVKLWATVDDSTSTWNIDAAGPGLDKYGLQTKEGATTVALGVAGGAEVKSDIAKTNGTFVFSLLFSAPSDSTVDGAQAFSVNMQATKQSETTAPPFA